MLPAKGMGGMKLSVCLYSIVLEVADVIDPLTGSRGLVPKSDFDEFMKGGRLPSVTSQRSNSSEHIAARYVQLGATIQRLTG
jgi:hypothetical protein